MKNIVVDVDDTICFTGVVGDYAKAIPNNLLIESLRKYKELGFYIIVYTSRNMRTYKGNTGKINKHTIPVLVEWLDKYMGFYDELIIGKPWCGFEGFYIDDKAIRPREFVEYNYNQIQELLKNDRIER
jgi:capsule biosynthesis phosphatase